MGLVGHSIGSSLLLQLTNGIFSMATFKGVVQGGGGGVGSIIALMKAEFASLCALNT